MTKIQKTKMRMFCSGLGLVSGKSNEIRNKPTNVSRRQTRKQKTAKLNERARQSGQKDEMLRSNRLRWVRSVFFRTSLLLMIPFCALLVSSLYFQLINVHSVVLSLVVTDFICAVWIVFAKCTSVDYTKVVVSRNREMQFPVILIIFLFIPFVCLCPSLDAHPYAALFTTVGIFLAKYLFGCLLIVSQLIFGGRFRQFPNEGSINAVVIQLSIIITLIYLFVLANVVVVKNAEFTLMDDLKTFIL